MRNGDLHRPAHPACSSVTKDLKEVVLNHAKHSDATLSPRAAALLRRIVRAQPPARIAMPAEVPTHCPPSHGSQSFSQVDVAEGALWRPAAVAPGGRPAIDELGAGMQSRPVHPVSRTQRLVF